MSTAEKAVLTSAPVQPVPLAHEVPAQPAPAPQGKPWWQKLAVPALVWDAHREHKGNELESMAVGWYICQQF
jgi:hypothetical protein